MGVTGDFSRLALLGLAIKKLGDDGVRTLTKSLAEEALRQVKLGFREGRNPYGVPWAPLRFRRGQPLRASARMQNSFTRTVGSGAFAIGTNTMYAKTHQYGATIVPKRKPFLAFKVPVYGASQAQGRAR